MKALEKEMFKCTTKTCSLSFSQTRWRVNERNNTKMAILSLKGKEKGPKLK